MMNKSELASLVSNAGYELKEERDTWDNSLNYSVVGSFSGKEKLIGVVYEDQEPNWEYMADSFRFHLNHSGPNRHQLGKFKK